MQKLLLFLHFNVLNEKSRVRGIIHLRNTCGEQAQKQSFSTGKLVIILLENQQQQKRGPHWERGSHEKKTKKKRNYFFNWIYMLEALRLCRAPCLPCLCSCQFCNNSSKNQISSTNLTRPTSVPLLCVCVCVWNGRNFCWAAQFLSACSGFGARP